MTAKGNELPGLAIDRKGSVRPGKRIRLACLLALIPAIGLAQSGAEAHDDEDIEEILVTATKQAGVGVQDVPLSMTAYGQTFLEDIEFRGLASLDNMIPNAQVGTPSSIPGNANLSIRGLGTNTNVASDEPTVGIFIDGVYIGLFYGSVFNTFDLEAVEVLRGPQGVLFGKNVTGGAVVLRTTEPKDEFALELESSYETGPDASLEGVLHAPIVDEKLSMKVAAYVNRDDGYYDDVAQEKDLSESETKIGRLAFKFTPSDTLKFVARFETGDVDGETDPPNENYGSLDAENLETSGLGFHVAEWDHFTLEANWDVAFGEGTVTNITGWRQVDADGGFDVDSLAERLFQTKLASSQNQFSNEIRYSGRFGDFAVIGGLYYFTQELQSVQQRDLNTTGGPDFNLVLTGGGQLDQNTYGIFASADWHITDSVTLIFGGRQTIEEKTVSVAALSPAAQCDYHSVFNDGGPDCNFDFFDSNTSRGFTPRIGVQWEPTADVQLYATWSRGLRGGGYSFRNTVPGLPPGPYEDEVQDAVELGIKTDIDDNVRINASVFHSVVENLQRNRIFSDPNVGAASLTGNVGDATYAGVEVEARVQLTEGLSLNGFVGVLEAHYNELTADLSGDGIVDQVDLNLDLVRAPPLTYGIGAAYTTQLESLGVLSGRVHYGYTDKQAYLDNNSAFLNERRMLNANFSLGMLEDSLIATIYGRNLLDKRHSTASVVLPAAFGGGYETIFEGRVVGASVRYRF